MMVVVESYQMLTVELYVPHDVLRDESWPRSYGKPPVLSVWIKLNSKGEPRVTCVNFTREVSLWSGKIVSLNVVPSWSTYMPSISV